MISADSKSMKLTFIILFLMVQTIFSLIQSYRVKLMQLRVSKNFSLRMEFSTVSEDLNYDNDILHKGNPVNVEILNFGELGARVLILDYDRYGMIYHDELSFYEKSKQSMANVGDIIPGYILKVRDDGKFDITTRPDAKVRLRDIMNMILDSLERSPDGCIPIGMKSPSSAIDAYFHGVSKLDFKKALASLFSSGKIMRPDQYKIELLSKSNDEMKPSRADNGIQSLIRDQITANTELKDRHKNEMIGDNDSDCDDEKHSSHGRYKLNTSAHRDHDELTLFVGNLPLKTSPNDFTTYLKNHYGENKVRNVRLITDKTTGALKGYGYIDVADMDTLQYMMMDLKRKDYQGRKLRVDKSLSEKSMNRKNELKSSDKQDPVSSSVTHASKSISSPHNKQIYTLFLGNIPYSTTKEAITEFVSDELGADNVADLRLNYDQQTGRLKPYGFIDVYGQETVETALLRIPSRPFHSSGNRNHEDHYFRIDVSESPKKKTLSSSKRLQENNNDRLHTSNDPHIIPTALYINNIPPHTDRDDFHSFMEEKLGKENIKEIRLVYDRDGNSKGFGFLDIYDEDFGHEAMKIIRSCQYDGYYLRADFSSIKKMK